MKDHIEYHRVTDTPHLILSDSSPSNYRFEPHYHLDYHIGLVVDGVQRQRFQGQSVLLGPGRISVMPPGEIHDGIGYDDNVYRMKTFRVSPPLLSNYFEDIFESSSEPCFGGAMIENDQISTHLLQLHHRIQQANSLSPLSVEELWLKLMAPLLEQLCVRSPKPVVGGLALNHWRTVREYCYENLAGKITLEQLAGLCGLSRYQFLRRFEKTTRVTPKAWLIRLRLEHACALLRGSQLRGSELLGSELRDSEQRGPNRTIAQIASEVGFYDQSHFTRAFRQAYGVTPSRY